MSDFPKYLLVLGTLCYAAAFAADLFLRTSFGFGMLILQVTGIFLLVSGMVISIVSRLNLWHSYHYIPTAKKLITSGLYRYFSHPMYVGNQIFFFGFAMVMGSIWGVIIAAVLILPIHIVRATWEEKVLVEKFGTEYIEYKKKVWI